MELLVIALDPGVTTGYALANLEDDTIFIAYGENRMNHREFYDFLPVAVDHVVCESFTFRQGAAKDGANLFPVELIGVLQLWISDLHRFVPIYFQQASLQGKSAYWSDAKLKEEKLYLKGVEHGRSAVKHLLHWLSFGAGFQFTKDQGMELVDRNWLFDRVTGGSS